MARMRGDPRPGHSYLSNAPIAFPHVLRRCPMGLLYGEIGPRFHAVAVDEFHHEIHRYPSWALRASMLAPAVARQARIMGTAPLQSDYLQKCKYTGIYLRKHESFTIMLCKKAVKSWENAAVGSRHQTCGKLFSHLFPNCGKC